MPFVGSRGKRSSITNNAAVKGGTPICDGRETATRASDCRVQCIPIAQASTQTDAERHLIHTSAQEPINSMYQSTHRDRSSTGVGHRVGTAAAAPAYNVVHEPVAEHDHPPLLECWKKAVDILKTKKPDLCDRLKAMEQSVREKEEDFTLQEPPDLLKLFESRRRKGARLPSWTQSVFRSILVTKDLFAVAAALDPHRAAPIAWRGFCVILEVRDIDKSANHGLNEEQ